LLAVALSMAVLLAWGALFPPPEPTSPTDSSQAAPEAVAPARVEREAAEPSPAATLGEVPEELPQPAPEPLPEQRIEAASEELAVVENDRFRARFTNRGAQLLSFELKEHRNAAGEWVDLVRARTSGPYPLGLVNGSGRPLALNEDLFLLERSVDEAGREVLEYRYSGPDGAASKRFALAESGLLALEVEVRGPASWALMLGPGLRNPSQEEFEDRFSRRSVVYQQGEEVERLDASGTDEPTLLPSFGVRWVGIDDRYFLSAVLPDEGLREIVVEPVLVTTNESGRADFRPLPGEEELEALEDAGAELQRELRLQLRADGARLAGSAYLGAKEYHRLAELPRGLEQSVNLGFFWFFARPLLIGLRWIHDNLIANYGWAIVLMTVLIRLVLFPLTHKSTVSMQKMQRLNPQIQAIRQKYRSKLKDKKGRPNPEMQRKMNEEVMALYKSEGVNPAGGCLPMLLQIPVLFAFYNLLSTAIELRHAPWMLWIQDLSAPDPFYVLPIVMGASQFLQQRLTPASGDPMQRRMFMLMPIFFTVLFLGFPSGLVLYWLTNNVLGIGQQVLYSKLREGQEAAQAGKGGKGKKEDS
jgi:YidC/Oxa1 family membrane protein insertase